MLEECNLEGGVHDEQPEKIAAPTKSNFCRRCCCCCCWRKGNRKCCLLAFVVLFLFVICWASIGRGFWARRAQHGLFGDMLISGTHDRQGRRIIRVCFFGDSLIMKTDMDMNICDSVCDELNRNETLSSFRFIPVEGGKMGDKISGLRDRMHPACLSHHPDAAILYWDSDASDVSEAEDTPETRAKYATNLDFVLSTMTTAMPNRVVMGGPTLLGEQPRGMNARDKRLDEPGGYVDMNRRAARIHEVVYLDTRAAFFAALPSNYTPSHECLHNRATCLLNPGFAVLPNCCYMMGSVGAIPCCYLTQDSEHNSRRGTDILHRMFVGALGDIYAQERDQEREKQE